MGLKTLLQEVMDVLGKEQADTEAVDMASDILKLVRAREMLSTKYDDRTRLMAMRIVVAVRERGAEAVYEKVLERRQ